MCSSRASVEREMQFSIEQKGVICAIEAHKLRLAQRQNVIYGAMLQNFARFYA